MKLYAPKYYKNFKCIAEKCSHSCCVGWEIDIDDNTFEKYKKLKDPYKTAILNSISSNGTPHFKLNENERCPHLDENGLCKIITNLGEEYLCDICRLHPRFYNYTTVCEVGLGISCEEAAKIILSSPDYAVLEEIGKVESEPDEIDFDGRSERSNIYKLLQNTETDYINLLNNIYSYYSIEILSDEDCINKLISLEYLNPKHKDLFINYSKKRRPSGKEEYLKRFLAYFIYRHCTEAFDFEDFSERLAFCLFCERLFASLISYKKADSLEEIATLATIISEEIEYSDNNISILME